MTKSKRCSKRLTEVAHDIVSTNLQVGDTAVDATVGNGRDTVFLRTCVGSQGTVYGFDIQPQALHATQSRLVEVFGKQAANVTLVGECHSLIEQHMKPKDRYSVNAIMFNLGYLPGGDHEVTTTRDTTVEALMASLNLLKPGGVLTVLVYTGHENGVGELEAIESLVCTSTTGSNTQKIMWQHFVSTFQGGKAPQLFVARRA